MCSTSRKEVQVFINAQSNPREWRIDVFPIKNKVHYTAVKRHRFKA